jgi:nucleoside-diphosphate-sugar epimerase
MKALVTGSTGFVGSHLVERLLQRNYKVRCLVRPETKLEYINDFPVELINGSYTDIASLKSAVAGVDYVCHVGGVTKSKTKEGYFEGNHKSTANLLRAVIEAKSDLKRFVLISSQTATGPGEGENPVDEETPCHPITTYGKSKLEAEKECLAVKDKIPITIVRPPAVYGPRDKDIFEFFNSANKHLVAMSGFNRKTVSLVHVLDLVDGIILAAESPKAVGKTYFIANEEIYDWDIVAKITTNVLDKWTIRVHIPHFLIYTIAAVSETIAGIQGKAALINIEKARDMVQGNWTCSVEKAKRELGYESKLTIEAGIENTIKWYKANGWL